MILLFSDWVLSKPQGGLLGYQYDNLTRELVVQGDLPEGWTWDILVSANGNSDTWPLALGDGQASITLTDDNLSVRGEYYLQLRGTNGDQVRHTNVITAYNSRSLSGAGQWPTLPTEWIQAEKDIKELNAHPPVPGENGYWLLWDLDTHSYVQSQLVVPGLHIEIGETTTGEPGTPANVTNSGTNTAPVLNFTIPEGEKGNAATIQVGTVAASDPGSEPQVKNSGTENAAVFDFVLPRGQTGPTGQAATIEVESTVTGEPGTEASVENVGTAGAAKLRFTIPRGNTGQNGATPTLSAGNVETLEPDQPATASVTGEGPAYQINLGIPRGKTGAQGAPGQNGQDGQTPTITVGTVTTLDPGQDATAEITGETPTLTLNLGIPEGQPGQDGVQLNDDAINTTEAWSSKKIVDTLCPSFSVSGNPVTCNPVEGYPLSAVVTLEPKQAGSGDPSPENVRPISGYDSVTVNVRGKNLLDPEFTTYDQDHLYWGKDSGGIRVEEGVTYTLSSEQSITVDGIYIRPISEPTETLFVVYNKSSITFTPTETSYVFFEYYETGQLPENLRNVMLEVGSTTTPYEPYQPGTTATITLPETIYGGTVDAVTGEGEKTRECIEFDGTESWFTWGPNSGADGVTGFYHYRSIDSDPLQPLLISSILLYNPSAYGGAEVGCSFGDLGNVNPYIIFSVSNSILSDVSSNQAAIKSWESYLAAQAAAGTPVQVAYKLATPESFQATGNQALPAVAGLNTVYTDGDSLAVSGRQDLLYTLQTMQAQTQNLNRFIAEGGTR